jgi:hypothetical protein
VSQESVDEVDADAKDTEATAVPMINKMAISRIDHL